MKSKALTQKESIINGQHFAYKMRNLYLKDENLFYQISDYLPNAIHINSRNNLDHFYANHKVYTKSYELETLIEKGASYLPKISCPIYLKASLKKINHFNNYNDFDGICVNAQKLKINNTFEHVLSNKLIIDDEKFFNISTFMHEEDFLGKIYADIIEPIHKTEQIWQQFQSLTKQEKKILRLLANGASNNVISDTLFISKHTVHTHRKNINKKLDTSSLADLVKFAMALDILQ